MKLLAPIMIAVALCGCPKMKETEAPPQPRTTPVAPNTPLDLDKPDQAKVAIDIASARDAIRKNQQIEGSNPQSLNQLGVRFFYPDDLVYDAASGTVTSKTYPNL